MLVLKGLIYQEELIVEEEFSEIIQDMQTELSKFGTIVSLEIPRPNAKGEPCAGMGNVFVYYKNVNQAKNARRDLVKRLFRKRIVEACYHDLGRFLKKDYVLKSHFEDAF